MSKRDLLLFIETPTFRRSAEAIPVSDEELRRLQETLCDDPDAGDLIPTTGGTRKVRFGIKGRGKRGGARAIYLYVPHAETIYLLLAYGKSQSSDLSEAGKRLMRQIAADLMEE